MGTRTVVRGSHQGAAARVAIALACLLLATSVSATAPTPPTVDAQAGTCFAETGYCITIPAFQEYFRVRGGPRILGFPVSRELTLDGFTVQFFQRVVLQLQGESVARLNLLDTSILPITRANGSVFPPPDTSLAATVPSPSDPDYARQVRAFLESVSPDTLDGHPVGFRQLFNTTVPVDVAFGGAAPNPELLTLLNLEIWGLPTSHPRRDPNNGDFIYQRFQRGIMHYRADCRCTDGILVGDYFKGVLTGQNLPPDLADDVQGSRYLRLFEPGTPQGIAFLPPGSQPPPVQATATSIPAPTAVPTAAPTAVPSPTPVTQGTLSGKISRFNQGTNTSAPEANARVELLNLPGLTATADGQGAYELAGIPFGQHFLYARTQQGDTSDVMQVELNSPTRQLNIEMQSFAPALNTRIFPGRVLAGDGVTPVDGARVWRFGDAARTVTAPNGRFSLVDNFRLSYEGFKGEGRRKIMLLAAKGDRWGVSPDIPDPTDPSKPSTIRLDRVGSVPPSPTVLYDFIANADKTTWTEDANNPPASPTLTFAQVPAAPRGYVRWLQDQELADGSRPSRVLETHPRRVDGGVVATRFPQVFKPEKDDFFTARLSLPKGANQGSVEFGASFWTENGAQVGFCFQTCERQVTHAKAASDPTSAELTLVAPMPREVNAQGQVVGIRVQLSVNAGSPTSFPADAYSPDDRAIWAEAQVVRIAGQ